MMKLIVFVTFLAVVAAEEYYTTLNDHLDIDGLLSDTPRLNAFMDCFLDKGPCSELAESYKRHTPEAVVQACKKCNLAQKKMLWKFLEGIKKVIPEGYAEFRKKYDPENKYFDTLEQEISKY